MIKKIVLTAALLVTVPVVVFARVMVISRTGTLKITNPDGTFVSVAPKEELPVIVGGSILEFSDDSSKDNAKADILIDGEKVQLKNGDKIQIVMDGGKNGFTVLNGSVGANDGDDKIKTLTQEQILKPYTPPNIPDPKDTEKQIQADEVLKDISPITQ